MQFADDCDLFGKLIKSLQCWDVPSIGFGAVVRGRSFKKRPRLCGGDGLDDTFVNNRLDEEFMAPMRNGNPFILGLAGCYCDNLSFLLFCKGCGSPRTRGVV